MTFVMAFEQQGDFQGVRDKKAAVARNAIRRDPSMLTDERQRFELLGATLRTSVPASDIRDGLKAIDDTFGDDGAELRAAIDWLAQAR